MSGRKMMCAYCGKTKPWTREFFPNFCAECAATLYAPKPSLSFWERIRAKIAGRAEKERAE